MYNARECIGVVHDGLPVETRYCTTCNHASWYIARLAGQLEHPSLLLAARPGAAGPAQPDAAPRHRHWIGCCRGGTTGEGTGERGGISSGYYYPCFYFIDYRATSNAVFSSFTHDLYVSIS